MKRQIFYRLFLAIFGISLAFRLAKLDLRPMHHDEANQAVKFGNLLEQGEYRYDRAEHHGPSLYYLSLASAWIFSAKSLASLDETALRLVPALFGAGILLLFLFFKGGISREALLISALLAALSPALVYFSRFYIQEMLLVFFLAGFMAALWRYLRRPSAGWALAAGLLAGLMSATKETFIISLAAILGGLWLSWIFSRKPSSALNLPSQASLWHFLAALGMAVLVAWLFYSSFFKHPQGFLEAILSFRIYIERAAERSWHAHPWHYYLKMLAFSRPEHGPVWTEGLVLVLAVLGGISAFRSRSGPPWKGFFLKFMVFYTALATLIYSSLRYKTPWNLLTFYLGFILLAGEGAKFFLSFWPKLWLRRAAAVILGVAVFHLGLQSHRANFRMYADPLNPYVYAQTSVDFLRFIGRLEDLAGSHPEGKEMLVKVIASPYETWPLPWYLRSFKRVGYWQEAASAGDLDVPVIISSSEEAEKLSPRLEQKFQTEYYGLRPGVLLALYIRIKDWGQVLPFDFFQPY